MKCPFCKSIKNVKNGHAPSGKKRYKCKRCNKAFSEVSKKNYPATSVPFEFIAFILHRSKSKSLDETTTIANNWLKKLRVNQSPICSKEKVSRSCIYKWRKNYGSFYYELVSQSKAIRYMQPKIKHAFSSNEKTDKENPFDNQDYEIITKEKKQNNMELLQLIEQSMGKKYLRELITKYPNVFEVYKNKLKNVEYETIKWK